MTHLSTRGPDMGFFSTLEVRPRSKPSEMTSRTIMFPRNNYSSAPNVAGGFKMLDLAAHPSSGANAVRANLVGWDVSKDEFKVGLETWDGGRLYAAEACWIEHKNGAKECHFGQFDSMDVEEKQPLNDELDKKVEKVVRPLLARSFSSSMHLPSVTKPKEPTDSRSYSQDVSFPVTFRKPPVVVCWLNRIDIPSGSRFRLRASCEKITNKSATVRLGKWGDNAAQLNGAGMCWIAFPRGKRLVESGSFGAGLWDEEENEGDQEEPKLDAWINSEGALVRGAKGRVKFRKGWFPRTPTVLVALNMLDMSGNVDLRICAVVENVTKEGFEWSMETWGDSILYAASASWIALGFE